VRAVSRLLVGLLKVSLRFPDIRLHRIITRSPPRRTHFPMLVSELKSPHQSQCLINTSPHRHVIDRDLPQHSIVIYDEKPPERNSLILFQNPVLPRDLHCGVRDDRDLHVAKTSLLSWHVGPRVMAEVGVCGAGQHLAVELLELCGSVVESDYFCRADKSEVQRVEEEDDIGSSVV